MADGSGADLSKSRIFISRSLEHIYAYAMRNVYVIFEITEAVTAETVVESEHYRIHSISVMEHGYEVMGCHAPQWLIKRKHNDITDTCMKQPLLSLR